MNRMAIRLYVTTPASRALFPRASKSFATPAFRSSSLVPGFSLRKFSTPNLNNMPREVLDSTGVPPSIDATLNSPEQIAQGHAHKAVTSDDPALAKGRRSIETGDDYLLPHPIWHGEYVNKVEITRHQPTNFTDKLALWTIKTIRFNFDIMSGYVFLKPSTTVALNRVIFLETIAGIPGSIAGIIRHLASLRKMARDHGRIHTLFEEAENERMHLLTFTQMRQPGKFMRAMVFLSQGVFFNYYFAMYLISPYYCHRLVGYLEEEAVVTYTAIIDNYDKGYYKEWENMKVPEIARNYWRMSEDSTIRDLMLMIRADEAHHRDVNHCFAELKPDQLNPYKPGL